MRGFRMSFSVTIITLLLIIPHCLVAVVLANSTTNPIDREQAVLDIRAKVAEIQKTLDGGGLQEDFEGYKTLVEKYPSALVLRQGLVGLAGLLGIFDLSIAQETQMLAFQIERQLTVDLIAEGHDPMTLPQGALLEKATQDAYTVSLL